MIQASEEKPVIGWVEKVRIYPGGAIYSAKIDTGADHSSLHVSYWEKFFLDGEAWVRFTISPKNQEMQTLELPIHRLANITRHGAPDEERPVVLMGVCLGTLFKRNVEVNLADRRNFSFKMLIGRSFLEDSVFIDPSRKYTREPACPFPIP